MKTYSKLLAAVLAAGSIALTAGTAAAAIEASQAEAIVIEEYPSVRADPLDENGHGRRCRGLRSEVFH